MIKGSIKVEGDPDDPMTYDTDTAIDEEFQFEIKSANSIGLADLRLILKSFVAPQQFLDNDSSFGS